MRRAPQRNQAASNARRARQGRGSTGKRTNRGGAGEPNTLAPRTRASPAPSTKPTVPPAIASINCSARKMPATDSVGRADGFHDADFGATLEHRGGGSGGHGERRSDQRGESDDPEQRADVREDFAFGFGHAANRAHVRAGQNLLDLVADRGNVGRAEPAVVFGGRQRLRDRARRARRRAW